MREWNALRSYPQTKRIVGTRTIHHRIIASYRGREFFDGERDYGYGGLADDGRWNTVAQDMVEDYHPDTTLQINCEKGFLLKELAALGVKVTGIESSSYARKHCNELNVISKWIDFTEPFDLVIALGAVYTLNLAEAMQCLRMIDKVSFNSFITLASYDTEEDLKLFKQWSLLACTILKKEEWIEVMNHCNYRGDYWFVNAKTLGLCSS